MANCRSVNFAKLRGKIDDGRQATISKFFPSNFTKDTNQRKDVEIINIEDSPTKPVSIFDAKHTSSTKTKKRPRERDLVEIKSSKKKCSNDSQINRNNPDDGQNPEASSKYLLHESTKLKLKHFEPDLNREKTELRIQQLKNCNLASGDKVPNVKTEQHMCISDSDDDVTVKENRLSEFNCSSQSSKGKSPVSIQTKTKLKYTPLEQQYIDINKKYPDALLLVECGYKYRLFGDDAEVAAKVLKIFCHLDHNFMTASIPTHRLFVHIRRLVSAGYKVGVVKQTETAALKAAGDNKSAPFTRQLQSLYTKSTLIGEDVNPISGDVCGDLKVEEQTSFLLCVYDASPTDKTKPPYIGIFAVQPSTGDIIYDCFYDNETRSELETRITHIQPAEILIPNSLTAKTEQMIKGIIDISTTDDDRIRLERQADEHFEDSQAFQTVSEFYKSDVKCTGKIQEIINLPKPVISCLSGVLTYLKDFNLCQILKLTGNFCQFSTKSLYMQLQSNVLRNLEVFQNLTDGKEKGTLFWAVNQTVTKFGARMLKSWLKRPLLSARSILDRQAAIHEILEGHNSQTFGQIKASLVQTPDLEKGISSIYYKKCSALEFFLVCKSLVKWSEDIQLISKQLDGQLSSDILTEILREIPELLDDIKSLLNNIQENNIRNKDKTNLFTDESLFPMVQKRKKEIKVVEKEMSDHRRTVRLILKQPAVDYVTVLGTEYLVEVKNNILHVVPKDWMKISSTKAVSRFHPPFIQATYKKLNQLREHLRKDCDEAWLQFLGWFEDDYHKFRKAVLHIATLDCLLSLASVARLHGYCRPKVKKDEVCINIEQGRHPVIHQLLRESQQFVPNDTKLSTNGHKCMIITGPNMGGKSSYIKQVALISILTQIGSYVPAESAEMGIVDAIYSRMGASDEIYRGRSTFMVELMEASDIMCKASSRSLVILDELGRGTSTHDGVAIAYATLDYFIKQIQCLTLFVTHYPVLSEFEHTYPDTVQNYHMSFMVNDDTDDDDCTNAVTFLYQLVSGMAGKSYGLNVARLASIPQEILNMAAQRSQEYENLVVAKREKEELFKSICSTEDVKNMVQILNFSSNLPLHGTE